MSYLSLLEEAARAVDGADLLGAERRLHEARRAWESSRVRAPLVEKGIEPLLRWGGRLLGRRGDSPVLPTFAHRSAEVIRTLQDRARVLEREARDLASGVEEELGASEQERAAHFLLLLRESETFRLESHEHWPLLRVYMAASRRCGRPVDAALLPRRTPAGTAAREWLGSWTDHWLVATSLLGEDVAEIARWLLEVAHGAEEDPPSVRARWRARAARLALLGDRDGPRALRLALAALEGADLDPAEARAVLRLAGGLVCNEAHVAVTGAACREDLRALASRARELGVAWPPPELEALLRQRRPRAGRPVVVTVAWSEGGQELLLLRHHGDAPCDALLLRPREQRGREDFELTPTRARAALEDWIDRDGVLLLESAPPPNLAALLGGHLQVHVGEVERLLPPRRSSGPAREPFAPHPMWSSAPAEPWAELLVRARGLLPRAAAVAASDGFRSGWGRENLRSLGRAGLGIGAAMLRMIEALEPTTVEDLREGVETSGLQRVPLAVEFRWPRLTERPWPLRGRSALGPEPDAEVDLLVPRHPSPAQLAGQGLRDGPSLLLVVDRDRALEVAASAAASGDPREVTVAPDHALCPEPLLQLLERWVDAGLGDRERALDALWLYRALAECPEGDPPRWLREGGSERAHADLRVTLENSSGTCGDSCRLRAQTCFAEQREERRRNSRLWIERLDRSPSAEDLRSRTLLVDDLCLAVASVPDERARERLRRVGAVLRAAPRVRIWVDAGPARSAVAELVAGELPRGRSLRVLDPGERPAAVVLLVPSGYEPGCGLLAEEAERLVLLRRLAWEREQGRTPRWVPATDPLACEDFDEERLHGRAPRPSARDVVVCHLTGSSSAEPLLSALRLACAATHAAERLICLDPRARSQLGAWLGTAALEGSEALGPGARLLDAEAGRLAVRWRRPLDAERLSRARGSIAPAAEMSAPVRSRRLEQVVRAFADHRPGGRLVVGGLRVHERAEVARVLRTLARESGDGGPLRTRCVLWVGVGDALAALVGDDERARILGADDGEQVAAVLREVEGGAVDFVGIAPELLRETVLDAWARRVDDVTWWASQAERGLADAPMGDPWPGGVLSWLLEMTTESGATLVADVDDPLDHEGLPLRRVAARLQASRQSVTPEAPMSELWSWRRRRPEDPTIACGVCGTEAGVSHAHSLCPGCARALVRDGTDLRDLRDALLERVRETLGEEGPRGRWLVVTEDAASCERLRTRLGIAPFSEGEAPLLTALARGAFDHDIVQAAELWDLECPPADLLLTRVPREARWLRALLWRLYALGWDGGRVEVMDHPLQWAEDLPRAREERIDPVAELAGRRLRWGSSRAEVEFRFRRALESIVTSLRLRDEAGGGSRDGLGPPSDPHQLPRLAPLALAVDQALAMEGRARLLDLDAEGAVAAVRCRGEWVVDLMEALAERGVVFGADQPVVVAVSDLSSDVRRSRILAALLLWAAREGLLRVDPPIARRAQRLEPDTAERRLAWLREARTYPPGEVVTLPAAVDDSQATRRIPAAEVPSDLVPPGGRRLGLAGTGRTANLVQIARGLSARGERVLVLVAGGLALVDFARRLDLEGHEAVELATPNELALAFLRHHRSTDRDGARLRLLPAATNGESEETRRRLMREASRLYAVAAGRVPAVESAELARVIDGEDLLAHAASSPGAIDVGLLRRCAEDARREAGWLHVADLRELSRRWLVDHPESADRWRDRYGAVLIDDLHALHADQRDFLDRMFPAEERWDSADPALLPHVDEADFRAAENRSRRLPKEIVRALERLGRDAPPWPSRPRARSGGRGSVESRRVLNLEACVRAIVEICQEEDAERMRTAVVVAHDHDRRHLAARLREEGRTVWMAEMVARLAAPGPRDLIATLLLAHEVDSLADAVASDLVHCVLAGSPYGRVGADPGRLVERLREGHAMGALDPRDAHEAFLAPLCDRRLRADATRRPLREIARLVFGSGLLSAALERDAVRGRLHDLMDDEGSRTWASLRERLDPLAIARPLAPGPHLWLARPDDLVGIEFDHVVHLCTGYEPPERHYTVAGRARERLTVLHSETDPYSDRV